LRLEELKTHGKPAKMTEESNSLSKKTTKLPMTV